MKRLRDGIRGICFSCERSRVLFDFRFAGNHAGSHWNGHTGMCRACIALASAEGQGEIRNG